MPVSNTDHVFNSVFSFIQTYTAIYYVIADLVMLSLYFYYKVKHRTAGSEFPSFLVGFSLLSFHSSILLHTLVFH